MFAISSILASVSMSKETEVTVSVLRASSEKVIEYFYILDGFLHKIFD